MKNFLKVFVLAVSLMVSLSGKAEAGTRDFLQVQGVIFDSAGAALTDSHEVTFRIYEVAAGGAVIWEEVHQVNFDNGVYSVSLGETTAFPDDLFGKESLFVGMTIDGDSEMSPRIDVHAVAWAKEAEVAVTAQSLDENAIQAILDRVPAGAQGPAGADGAVGPQGPAGPVGPQGPVGADGADGAQGPQGPQGIQGPAGTDGIDGAPGAQGPQGPQGPAGVDGTDGANGLNCWDLNANAICDDPDEDLNNDDICDAQDCQGAQGIAGPQGPAGVDGAPGAQGPQGPAGANGVDGADGAQGPQGPAGANGVDGADGAQGPQGPQGPEGADGTNGRNCWDLDDNELCDALTEDVNDDDACDVLDCRGADGAQGPAGVQGPQGPAGADGANGAQGPQGPAGAQGAQGPQGPAGANGAQGPEGPEGAEGPQGTSCWDLDQDSVCDAAEDKNGDTNCTVSDCQPSTAMNVLFYESTSMATTGNGTIECVTFNATSTTPGRLGAPRIVTLTGFSSVRLIARSTRTNANHGQHTIRLRNITDGTTLVSISSGWGVNNCTAANPGAATQTAVAPIDIIGTKFLECQEFGAANGQSPAYSHCAIELIR